MASEDKFLIVRVPTSGERVECGSPTSLEGLSETLLALRMKEKAAKEEKERVEGIEMRQERIGKLEDRVDICLAKIRFLPCLQGTRQVQLSDQLDFVAAFSCPDITDPEASIVEYRHKIQELQNEIERLNQGGKPNSADATKDSGSRVSEKTKTKNKPKTKTKTKRKRGDLTSQSAFQQLKKSVICEDVDDEEPLPTAKVKVEVKEEDVEYAVPSGLKIKVEVKEEGVEYPDQSDLKVKVETTNK